MPANVCQLGRLKRGKTCSCRDNGARDAQGGDDGGNAHGNSGGSCGDGRVNALGSELGLPVNVRSEVGEAVRSRTPPEPPCTAHASVVCESTLAFAVFSCQSESQSVLSPAHGKGILNTLASYRSARSTWAQEFCVHGLLTPNLQSHLYPQTLRTANARRRLKYSSRGPRRACGRSRMARSASAGLPAARPCTRWGFPGNPT